MKPQEPTKPTIFIGSSSKSLVVAQKIRDGLSKIGKVTVWNECTALLVVMKARDSATTR